MNLDEFLDDWIKSFEAAANDDERLDLAHVLFEQAAIKSLCRTDSRLRSIWAWLQANKKPRLKIVG